MSSNRVMSVDELAKNSKKAMKTHLNLLKLNSIDPTEENLVFNMEETLNKLKNKKGEPISNPYKCAIITTIRRLFPASKVSNKNYRNRQIPTDPESIKQALDLIDYAINTIKNVKPLKSAITYETLIAALFITFSGLRISEVMDLTFEMLYAIKDGRKIQIKTKTNSTGVEVPLTTHLDTLIDIIFDRKDYYQSQKLTFKERKRAERWKNDYVFSFSDSLMYSELRLLSQQINPRSSISFNTFRKCTTSALMNSNFIEEAALFNRHTTPETTAKYYTALDTSIVESLL